jgi:hypothetical protein
MLLATAPASADWAARPASESVTRSPAGDALARPSPFATLRPSPQAQRFTDFVALQRGVRRDHLHLGTGDFHGGFLVGSMTL